MWKKIGYTALVVLATLGVVFVVLMLIPDSEEEEREAAAALESEIEENDLLAEPEEKEEAEDQEDVMALILPEAESVEGSAVQDEDPPSPGTVEINIPADQLTAGAVTFQTTTLDGQKITDDIFSDYDITVVHVWGTYCGPCIAEMPDVAAYYQSLPPNINMVGLICDVYDGIDTNADSAWDILSDAGAEFLNLRTSDTLYDILNQIEFIPTSFLVDREGHIIGKVLEGTSFREVIDRVNSYIVE